MLLSFETFGGLAPKIHPKKLSDNLATIAHNCRTDRGVLEGWKGISYSADISTSKSLYRYNGGWLTSTYPRNYVPTLLPNDVRELLFYDDIDYPKIRSGAEEFKLGLPRPEAPTTTISVEGDKANITDVRNQRYVVTIVDAWGFEGPSSYPTIGVEVGKDSEVEVDLSPCTVTGNYNLGTGALFRIYRTNTGSSSTTPQFVAEVAYGTGLYTDSLAPGDLQESLLSADWVSAPDDDTALYPDGPLKHMVGLPGGVLAGFSGNTVFFSEPYIPTAWPYYHASKEKVVALAVVQGGLFVATEGQPYLLTGSHPSALAEVPVEAFQPCVSARGMVDMGEFAIYPSPDGLVAASGNSAQLITSEYLDHDSWAAFQPETIRAYLYEGLYIGFYGDVADATGFVYNPSAQQGDALYTFSGMAVDAGYLDPLLGDLYVGYEDSGFKVGEFDEGTELVFTWQSKEFLFPDPIGLGILRVEADNFPVTVEIIADKISRSNITLTDNQPVKFPGGYRAKEWQVKVSGAVDVAGVFLADNMTEMV